MHLPTLLALLFLAPAGEASGWLDIFKKKKPEPGPKIFRCDQYWGKTRFRCLSSVEDECYNCLGCCEPCNYLPKGSTEYAACFANCDPDPEMCVALECFTPGGRERVQCYNERMASIPEPRDFVHLWG
ncbi:hypothetical protein QBC47DRAFT_364879 [Echria macrotheca]|uniref:Uncharacterized protein n=1 Tax=Echria macrotheca TaxID=438768 RepID=A0AAJ0B3E0_9PEZI|nr:hypothetical protein QBC47DRAFT_364879 [Echria macrotheca]